MLGLVDALWALHEINCRHGDLKPENILHSKDSKDRNNPYGTLVIADVGVSKVHQQRTELRHDPTNTKATTPCYEAPEAEFDRLNPRGRRYDMWSLGCVFMELAIWLLYGHKAIEGFKQNRRPNSDVFPQKAAYYVRSSANDANAVIHPAVPEAFDAIKNDPRCGEGTGLAALVDIIACDLIVIKLEKRAYADQLKDKFSDLLKKARSNPDYLIRRAEPAPKVPKVFRAS